MGECCCVFSPSYTNGWLHVWFISGHCVSIGWGDSPVRVHQMWSVKLITSMQLTVIVFNWSSVWSPPATNGGCSALRCRSVVMWPPTNGWRLLEYVIAVFMMPSEAATKPAVFQQTGCPSRAQRAQWGAVRPRGAKVMAANSQGDDGEVSWEASMHTTFGKGGIVHVCMICVCVKGSCCVKSGF